MNLKNFLIYFKNNFLIIFLLFLTLLINIGSVFYYFYKFDNLVVFISLILSLFLTYLFVYFNISRANQQGLLFCEKMDPPRIASLCDSHFRGDDKKGDYKEMDPSLITSSRGSRFRGDDKEVNKHDKEEYKYGKEGREDYKGVRPLSFPRKRESNKGFKNRLCIFKTILSLITLILFFLLFQILFKSGSFSAIASPWHFLPGYFWIFLWSLILFLFINFYFKNKWSYLFLIFLYFLFFSISIFIYKIAFGYDQLLHQRSISDILKFGLIEPKTIYYIGQYVLEMFLLKIWPFSLELLDKLLVPFLSAILIPLTFIFNFKRRGFNKIIWPLILFLILPFSIFTYTVPQNLAFLFLVILLLFSFNKYFINNKYNFLFLFSLALSIFFIHPLAGVPAIIFTFILLLSLLSFPAEVLLKTKLMGGESIFYWFKFKSLFKVLKTIAYLGQILILPILLLFSGGRFSFSSINFSNWTPKFLGQENIFLNFIYFFAFNKNIWLLILFILATFFVFIKGKKELKIFYFNSLSLMLSYFLSLFIDFPFLSRIDKGSYANRILILSFLFLIPVFYEMFICLIKKIKEERFLFRVILSIFLLILILTSLYVNYPRKDNYFNSRSYSVSGVDFEAVRFIENIKESDNYIVLANQQVGASAIKEYGFKRYYGPWFYYSVQTGGLLYDYYLKMLENPNRKLMSDLAFELGSDSVYLVVNDYWWAFDRIIEEAKIEADFVYSVAEGRVMVFYFKF